jgi:hypothetical protein
MHQRPSRPRVGDGDLRLRTPAQAVRARSIPTRLTPRDSGPEAPPPRTSFAARRVTGRSRRPEPKWSNVRVARDQGAGLRTRRTRMEEVTPPRIAVSPTQNSPHSQRAKQTTTNTTPAGRPRHPRGRGRALAAGWGHPRCHGSKAVSLSTPPDHRQAAPLLTAIPTTADPRSKEWVGVERRPRLHAPTRPRGGQSDKQSRSV